jgi:hypothetical protein
MAVVIEEAGIPGIKVGVEPFTVKRGMSKRRLIQLKKRIVGAPWPDAGVIAAGALIAMKHDIMLDQGAIRRPGDNAVAADIFREVVTYDDVQAGIPLGAGKFGALAHNRRSVDFPHDVPLDGQAVESAGHFIPVRPEEYASALFAFIRPIDIVDIEIGDKQMMRRAKVCYGNQYASPKPRLRSMVRDLKMAYFDLFNIQQLDYILDLPIPVDTRQRSFSKPVDHNGSALLTRA